MDRKPLWSGEARVSVRVCAGLVEVAPKLKKCTPCACGLSPEKPPFGTSRQACKMAETDAKKRRRQPTKLTIKSRPVNEAHCSRKWGALGVGLWGCWLYTPLILVTRIHV